MSAQAVSQLRGMRSALARWLEFRTRVDHAASSNATAATIRTAYRDEALEARLGAELYGLLSQVTDPANLPDPRVPGATVLLARMAAGMDPIPAADGNGALGMFPFMALFVVLGLAFWAVTSTVKTLAEQATERERIACIRMGQCTDWNDWMKWGAIALGGWVLWTQLGVGDAVKKVAGSETVRSAGRRARGLVAGT